MCFDFLITLLIENVLNAISGRAAEDTMDNIKPFEPLFGEWYAEGEILSSDRETVFKA